MRITRQKLVELARGEAERRGTAEGVVAVYGIGSLARGDPLLGGAADIDLVVIHQDTPPLRREVVPLSEEVHLDIAHHARHAYEKPRQLRVHPWYGPAICEPLFLYDPRHFFEWVQAGVRGQFFRAESRLARAAAFLRAARQRRATLAQADPWVRAFAKAALEAANAAASLTGFPAAGRAMALALRQRLLDLGRPDLYAGFLSLLGAQNLDGWQAPEWISAWGRAFDAARTAADPVLHLGRRLYFLRAFQSLAEAGEVEALVWPLVSTWSRAVANLRGSPPAAEHAPAWESFLQTLGLGAEHRAQRETELETYLDEVEALLQTWAHEQDVRPALPGGVL